MRTILLIFACLLIAASALAGGGASPVLHPAAYANARQWKNIMDFGAKGDGTTNDRPAIQAALDAVPDSGGCVFVPHSDSGFLISDSTLIIKSYTTLLGLGRGSKILLDPSLDTPFIMIKNTHWDGSSPADSGIVIDGIYWDMGRDYTTYDETTDWNQSATINFRYAHKCIVQNCFVTRSHKIGIVYQHTQDSKILNNVLWEMGQEAIAVAKPTGRRNIVSGNHCIMRDTSYTGIAGEWIAGVLPAAMLLSGGNTTVSDNIFRYGGGGIDMFQQVDTLLPIDTTNTMIISNNQFVDIVLHSCISPQRGHNLIISGNVFRNCNAHGIYTTGPGDWEQGQAGPDSTPHDILITGNQFLDHHKLGIWVENGHGHTITNNVFSNLDTTAIVSGGDRSVITGNRITEVAGGYGIHIKAQLNSIVANNQISYVDKSGIRVETFAVAEEYLEISGNSIKSSGEYGIELINVDLSTINGNVCVDNALAGIYATNSYDNLINSNICTSSPDSTQGYGLLFESSSNRNVVFGNMLGGNTIAANSGMVGNLEYGNVLDTAGTRYFTVHGKMGIGTDMPHQAYFVIDTIGPGHIYLNAMDTGGIAAGDIQIRFDSAGSLGFSIVFDSDSSSGFYIHNHHVPESRPIWIARNGVITFNKAYTFPNTDGTAGYVLETNGSGALSWQPNDTTGIDVGTADSMGVDTTGDGTPNLWVYSVGARGAFTLSEGTNISLHVTGDTVEIEASGGSGAWTTAGDTAHLIDADNDTLARFWDNDGGAVTWDIGADQTTLHIVGKADTGDYLGADTVRVFVTNRVDTLTANMVLNGGNIVMLSTELVDGVDVSAHAADEDAHHDRYHNMTSTDDHGGTAYRMYYTNNTGIVTGFAHGANGQVLTSGGVEVNPSWETPGTGSSVEILESDVSKDDPLVILNFMLGFDVVVVNDTSYVTLDLTEDQVDLTTEVTGELPDGNVSDNLTVTGYMQDEDINTFDELQTWVTDKTLVNQEDAATISGVWAFVEGLLFQSYDDVPANAPYLALERKRDGTPTSNVSSGDYLGNLLYMGWHTAGYVQGAIIRAIVDGTPGGGDMPTRLEFLTTPDDAATPEIRMTIDNAGDIAVSGTVDTVDIAALGATVPKITDDTADFKTAYGWGDHSTQNYLDNDDANVDTAAWNAASVGAWVASNDTMFLIDGDGDTLAAYWDDDAGNVRWQVATEDQTLRMLLDTLGIGGDVIADFAGDNLSVTANVLNATIPAQGDSTYWDDVADQVAADSGNWGAAWVWGDHSAAGYAPLASPTFTGTVTIPTPFTLGAVSVTATGTELNYVGGVTSAIQTQLDAKEGQLNNSAGLAAALSDETGTGVTVFGTQPTFTTDLECPLIIGGTGTTSDLFLKTTSGVGETGADMHFLVGNDGATEAMTILNNGNVGIGKTSPDEILYLFGNNATLKFEDDSENKATINVGNSQLCIAADPDDLVESSDICFDIDGDEVARFHQSTNFGIGTLSPAERLDVIGNIAVSGTVDTVDVGALAAKVHNEDLRHFIFAFSNPNSVYDTDSLLCIKPVTEKAITVTRIDVTCDADPATEPAMKLNHTDNFISRTTPTTIDVITTTAGVTTITSGFDDATIPASRCIYFAFTADPIAAIKSITVDITYTID